MAAANDRYSPSQLNAWDRCASRQPSIAGWQVKARPATRIMDSFSSATNPVTSFATGGFNS